MDVEYTWEVEGRIDQPLARGPVPNKPAGRWWPTYLVLLGILFAVLWLVGYQVRTIQFQAETAAIDEAESSFSLAFAAIEEDDEEVFHFILPGNDLSWTDAQRKLFQESALFDRDPFGLQLTENAQEIVSTEMSPDLTQATVLSTQQYHLDPSAGAETAGPTPAGPITLQFTTFLQKKGGQWAWQAPEAAFWGDWQQLETSRLRIIYPERDADILRPLADDLDQEVNQLCDQFKLVYCPEGVVLDMHLSIDPAVLVALAAGPPPRGEEGEFILPTPTLMGRPADEASYRAVLRGYAAQSAAALIKKYIGWECSDPLILYINAQEKRLVC